MSRTPSRGGAPLALMALLALSVGAAACTSGGSAKHASGSTTTSTAARPVSTVKPTGFAAESPADILAAATKAALAATSVHIVAKVQMTPTATLNVDARFGHARATGSLTSGAATSTFIRVGDDIYVSGNHDWFAGIMHGAATSLEGKWFKIAVSSPAAQPVYPYTDLNAFFGGIAAQGKGSTLAGVSQVDGKAVVNVRTARAIFSIAIDSPHLPLKTVGLPNAPGSITFTEWNAPFPATAPAPGLLADPSSIPGLGRKSTP